jgi:16S rRNA (cytidine1402-2'-O)-methyltransferase
VPPADPRASGVAIPVLDGSLLEHLQPGTRLSVSAGLTLAGASTRSAPVSEWRARPGGVALELPAVFAFLAR